MKLCPVQSRNQVVIIKQFIAVKFNNILAKNVFMFLVFLAKVNESLVAYSLVSSGFNMGRKTFAY